MKRLRRLLRIIGLLVLSVPLFFWPVIGTYVESTSDVIEIDPVVITHYVADYTVTDQGNLNATETITGLFPEGRHGIYRFWDIEKPGYPTYRLTPTIKSITKDGQVEPALVTMQKDSRFVIAKIGDPDTLLSAGTHTYVISYTIQDVLIPQENNSGSQFKWNVVAPAWQNNIDLADITIHLPSSIGDVTCDVFTKNVTDCNISKDKKGVVSLQVESIASNTGVMVTVPLSMSVPTVHSTAHLWRIDLDPVLGSNIFLVILVLLFSFMALYFAIVLRRRLTEVAPAMPVMYEPPKNLGPVQTLYAETDGIGDNALIATLFYLANLKFISLEEASKKSWKITRLENTIQKYELDPVSSSLFKSLGIENIGDVFLADGSKSSGEKLILAKGQLDKQALDWSRNAGLLTPETGIRKIKIFFGLSTLIGALLALEPILAAGILSSSAISLDSAWPTMLALPFFIIYVVLGGIFSIGLSYRHTEEGKHIWSQAGGFRRMLSTPSSEQRFDFSARKEIFLDYIPYAVAFNVAQRWADKYETETGIVPPTPFWYPQTSNLYNGGTGFRNFNDSISSSISAYKASQKSSGRSGSGSRSGGGGGGGGSW